MKIVNTLVILSLIIGCNINYSEAAERKDKGAPITQEERQKATDDLIAIMKGISYFDFVDSRAHGMPEKNSNQYWWGTWWTGVQVQKTNGQVTYTHQNNGSDNTGIQTSPYLEGACFAYLLTKDEKYARLSRKLIRGMSSWILSSATDKVGPTVLSRSFYPHSTQSLDGGRDLYINYEASRPGINNVADYVHNPNNPFFGDVYLKNKRSTDDIGHMIRAIANVQACRDAFDKDTRADLDQMNTLYANWAKSVDDNNYNIPTHNDNLDIITIKKGLGDYNAYNYGVFDPNCIEKLAVRFLHASDTGKLRCNKGISFLEKLLGKSLQNDAIEILRSHHTAAVALAKLKSQDSTVNELIAGMENRMNRDFAVIKDPTLSPKYDLQDIPSFFINATNIGVNMTSEEMRFLYGRLSIAKTGILDPAHYNTFHLFDSSVPNGTYSYDPPHPGLYFYTLGAMIGSCTSAYRNPNGRQLLDCDRLKAGLAN